MISSILSEKPTRAIDNFMALIDDGLSRNKLEIRAIAIRTIKYLQGNSQERGNMRDGQELENRWYESLKTGKPDYSVYDTDYYLAELWACWAVYSRKYLNSIQSPKSLGQQSITSDISANNCIIDLGCGFGYTTAALKELFPSATVIGTNISDTRQMKLAQKVGEKFDFEMRPDASGIDSPADLVFASEYFEHILDPIKHLHEILRLKPKHLLIANAFGTIAIGHFDRYSCYGKDFSGKQISKIFNSELRRLGYMKVKTKLWNNRPSYWVRLRS